MPPRPPIIAVTPGDPAGIGPEIAWKTICSGRFRHPLLCIGARAPFDDLGVKVTETTLEELRSGRAAPPRSGVWLLPAPARAPRGRFLPGFQAGWSVETATRLALEGVVSAVVTGPISKERLQRGGYPYAGHTDFLAALCARGRSARGAVSMSRAPEVTMMLANDTLRISLVTVHMALKDVPRAVTREKIRRAVNQTVEGLRKWWGIARPRIGVAALNPHAGESGIFGDEERKVIAPELRALRAKHGSRCVIAGPLPADTLFANHVAAPTSARFDAVICMYHDQGLIPVKLLDFPRTVNVTLGLPIVRTSVDHGTAFDIAGQGIADPTSLRSAIDLAIRIVNTKAATGRR